MQGQLLLDAARGGAINQARNLLDKGTDPRTSLNLHNAAKRGEHSVGELLLGCRADPNATEKSGSTSLHYAALDGHDDKVQLPLE